MEISSCVGSVALSLNSNTKNTVSKLLLGTLWSIWLVVIIALHSVLDLIETLLLPVESLQTNEVESVIDAIGLDVPIKG